MTYRPPFLRARIGPRCAPPPAGWRAAARTTYSGTDVEVHVDAAAATRALARTPDGAVGLFFVGSPGGASGPAEDERLLEAYLDEGPGFVRTLNGSFGILVVDMRSQEIIVITDPANTRQLYSSTDGDFTWVASAHAFHSLPVPGNRIDPTAIAQYMVNGIPLNHRTLFEGIRVLEQASVHRFGLSEHSTESYWRYEFHPSSQDREAMADELMELTAAAVRRSVGESERPYVSLSGGYDSPAIACELHRMNIRDVVCFSYEDAGASAKAGRTDAVVARELADGLGYRHELLPAYRSSLFELIRHNVRHGAGLTRLTVESDAWVRIGSSLLEDPESVVLVGEEFYGGPDADLEDEEDVLAFLGIRGWGGLAHLSGTVPAELLREWEGSISMDLREMLGSLPSWHHPHDLKDLLYLHFRLARRLAWREHFAGSFAEVRFPLLDRELLEFMQGVPTEDRRGKRLFQEALIRRYPSRFSAPRATSPGSMIKQWSDQALDEETHAVRERLLDSSSNPLDELVPPTFLLELLSAHSRGPWRQDVLRRSQRKLRRLSHRLTGRGFRSWSARPLAESVLLVRALFLREVLADRLSPGAASAREQ